MQKEYDFSKGVRAKFYTKDATFQLPIYLDPEVQSFVSQLASEQKRNLSEIVNKLLMRDKELFLFLTQAKPS